MNTNRHEWETSQTGIAGDNDTESKAAQKFVFIRVHSCSFVFIRVYSWFVVLSLSLASTLAGCATHHDIAPCCAKEVAAGRTVSDRSIYQLESSWTNDVGSAVKLEGLADGALLNIR